MLIFLLVDVEKGMKRKVGEKLLMFDEVKNVHLIDKEVDIIVRAEVKDVAHLEKLITNGIRPIKGVLRTETLISSN